MRYSASTIKYDTITYIGDKVSIYVIGQKGRFPDVVYSHGVDNIVDQLMAHSLMRLIDYSVADEAIASSATKYHLKEGDCFWVSDKFNFFAGSKEVKPGKLLASLGVDKYRIDSIMDSIHTKKVLATADIKISEVESIYNSPKLKIGSCMTGEDLDLSLYNDMGAKVATLSDYKGNIVARTIIWENDSGIFHDTVYTVSTEFSEAFKRMLRRKNISKVVDFTTSWIQGDPNKRFVPYMDNVRAIEIKDGYYRFTSNRSEQQVAIATSTNGYIDYL